MTSVGSEIVEYLKECHIVENKAIKARELCILFNLTDKQLRNVVSELRQEGEAVCSSSYGYWYSRNPEDIEKTLRRLEGQVINMNIAISGLKLILQEVDNADCKRNY